ncbi:MAG: hypothetical protein LBL92_04905, partial [Propionibacteriaceae bacterium]|nr:hypothetical protein [Propionibacteriaceae bacterium]
MIRRLRGALAAVALLLIVVAAPVALSFAGQQVGLDELLRWSEVGASLSRPDDGRWAVGFLLFVGWVAWLYLTVSIGVELIAQWRRRPLLRLSFFKPGR